MRFFNKQIAKSNFVLVIIVTLLFIVIIDVFLYLKVKNDREYLINDIEKTEEQLETATGLIADEFINGIDKVNRSDVKTWSVYNNVKYKVSFRYPKYFSKHEYPVPTGGDEPVFVAGFDAYNDEFTGRMYFSIYNLAWEKTANKVAGSLKDVKIEELEVAGLSAKKIIGTPDGGVITKNNAPIATLVVENNGMTYVLMAEDNEIFDKIVSTITLN